jgi:hypothetical protein
VVAWRQTETMPGPFVLKSSASTGPFEPAAA